MTDSSNEEQVAEFAAIPTARESSPLELDGRQASTIETNRAARTVSFLRAILPKLHEPAAAQALHDIGCLLARPLDDQDEALVALHDAFRRQPQAPHIARSYRKAAMHLEDWAHVLCALEAEAKLWPAPQDRASLEAERAWILEHELGNVQAAQAAYGSALESNPANISALAAHERLATARQDYAIAAKSAQRMAESATTPQLRAEHGARAARLLGRSKNKSDALGQAALAESHSPSSPSVRFVLERIYSNEGKLAELVALREAQIADRTVDPAAAWLDIGILARYKLDDRELAASAFRAAADAGDSYSRTAALGELSSLLARSGDWSLFLSTEESRLALEETPTGRAAILHRMAVVHEERLNEEDRAVEYFEKALAQDAGYLPALEGLGRIYHRLGAKDRLLRMHQLEAKCASTPQERSSALRRAGELLVEDPERIDEGIESLRASLAETPGNLFALSSLEAALTRKGAWHDLVALYESELARTEELGRRGWLLAQIGTIAADLLGDRARATAAFRQAAEVTDLGPHHVLTRLAQLLEETGELEELASVLTRLAALVQEPAQVASILERVAKAHEQRGALDAAIEAYCRAVEVAPPSHAVYTSAGRAFLRAGRYAEMAAMFDRAAETTGDPSERATYLYKTADVLWRYLGRVNDAAERLRTALSLQPTHVPARLTLISLLTEEQRWLELAALLAELPADGSILLRRAVLAEAVGHLDEALALYRDALAAGAKSSALPYARLLADTGSWKELADYYANVDGARLAKLHARYRAGEICAEQLGENARATGFFQEALAEAPDSIPVLLALLPLVHDEPQHAIPVLRALETHASDPSVRGWCLTGLAKAHGAAGDTEAALGAWMQVLETRASDPIAQVAAELILEQRQDRRRLADLLRLVSSSPSTPGAVAAAALSSLSSILEELGSLRDAADANEATTAKDPEYRSVATMVSLARIYQTLGDKPRRRASLRSLAESLPPSSERAVCFRILGRELAEGGEPEQAIAAHESALRADPKERESLVHLEGLLAYWGLSEHLIDHLLRAFDAEEDPKSLVAIGTALATRLVAADRLLPA
ncbi:MAG: tetratricopeptide repeat protein, partial [Pseudomonadota bacterium]